MEPKASEQAQSVAQKLRKLQEKKEKELSEIESELKDVENEIREQQEWEEKVPLPSLDADPQTLSSEEQEIIANQQGKTSSVTINDEAQEESSSREEVSDLEDSVVQEELQFQQREATQRSGEQSAYFSGTVGSSSDALASSYLGDDGTAAGYFGDESNKSAYHEGNGSLVTDRLARQGGASEIERVVQRGSLSAQLSQKSSVFSDSSKYHSDSNSKDYDSSSQYQ